MSDLIAMDKTYLDRLCLREKTMDENPAATIQCNAPAEPAVLELYTWLTSTYLPKRFPMIYQLKTTTESPCLHNTASGLNMPTHPPSAKEALYTLGQNIDTDFLLLLPSSTDANGHPIYHLEAFVTCFPAGFSTKAKLGLPLAAIHGPVPGYAAKLERSMDRFFARLEVGRVVRRTNWGISTNDILFSEGGNHLYGEETEANLENQRREVKVEDCRLRCERQTLHRLPESGALVFAFKTYLYTLQEVKDEGLGEVLAEAIEGLGKGSVPEMEVYKRKVVWGEKVKEFLRS